MSSLKTSVITGHMPQEEVGVHDLRVSVHPTPYSEKENQVLTLVLVDWKGSLTLTRENAQLPALCGENFNQRPRPGHEVIPPLKAIC